MTQYGVAWLGVACVTRLGVARGGLGWCGVAWHWRGVASPSTAELCTNSIMIVRQEESWCILIKLQWRNSTQSPSPICPQYISPVIEYGPEDIHL